MKKIIIFSVLFIGFFCGIFNYAKAETKDFYIPIGKEKSTLGDVIKNNLFNKALALVNDFYSQQIGEFHDHVGWGGSDWYFGVAIPPRDYIYNCGSSESDPGFDSRECDMQANCWVSRCWANIYNPWQVTEAELITDNLQIDNYNYDDDKDKCRMDVHIVGVNSFCGGQGYNPNYNSVFASAEDSCKQSDGGNSITASLPGLNTNSSPAAGVCAHLYANGARGPNANVYWTGSLRITARRTSLDSFSVTGIDARTKQSKTIGEGQAMEICQGDSVTVNWRTSDSASTRLHAGGSSAPTSIYQGGSGDMNYPYTPNETVTFLLSILGVTGDGSYTFFSRPINIIPRDCSGECNPLLSNPNVKCIAKYGYGIACCNNVTNLCDVCGGGPEPSTPIPETPKTGNLDVKIRLNGVEVTEPTDVIFDLNGPETINANEAPKMLSDILAGTYNLRYVSGGPDGSTFINYSPGQSLLVSDNGTATVYLEFSDGVGRCNITVQALKYACDGSSSSPWTGALSYGLLGPIILNGTAVDQTFENVPVGRYYLTSLVGGPGTYNGVTPGNPVPCPSDGNVTLMMRFND